MNQPLNISLTGTQRRLITFLRRLQQFYSSLQPASIRELLNQIKQATAPTQLSKATNRLQRRLSRLPREEQVTLRRHLIDSLTAHVLTASLPSLRMEAAQWLRLLIQTGLVEQPQAVFVTLVTAATRIQQSQQEQHAYLKMIVDCFWSFRFPYPAYPWQMFPSNGIFYPLAPLLDDTDITTQELLIAIFSELSTVNDPPIAQYLLPLALNWSKHADAAYRQRITIVLARMQHTGAQEALRLLQRDPNPAVRVSARHALSYIRRD